MTIEEFSNLDNFHISEKDMFGRPIIEKIEIIKPKLMYKLDEAVAFAKQEFGKENGAFIIHCIVLGEHSAKSKHYSGEAVDGHFRRLNLYQQVFIGLKVGFRGVGYYPDWKNKGVHFDTRKQTHVSTWLQWNGEYIYDYDKYLERLLFEAEA